MTPKNYFPSRIILLGVPGILQEVTHLGGPILVGLSAGEPIQVGTMQVERLQVGTMQVEQLQVAITGVGWFQVAISPGGMLDSQQVPWEEAAATPPWGLVGVALSMQVKMASAGQSSRIVRRPRDV